MDCLIKRRWRVKWSLECLKFSANKEKITKTAHKKKMEMQKKTKKSRNFPSTKFPHLSQNNRYPFKTKSSQAIQQLHKIVLPHLAIQRRYQKKLINYQLVIAFLIVLFTKKVKTLPKSYQFHSSQSKYNGHSISLTSRGVFLSTATDTTILAYLI